MSTQRIAPVLLAALVLLVVCTQADAVPMKVSHMDTPECDVLSIPVDVHEIGHYTEFPVGERLDAIDRGATNVIPCPLHNDPTTPEVPVEIRNLTGIDWAEVWYIADKETTLSNYDGEANAFGLPLAHEAFRIDRVGSNRPLILESIATDGIWQAGESWVFVIQDYTNSLGLPATAITSIGVGDLSSSPATGIIESSGSIIARAIPEPVSAGLLLLGLCLTAARRRGR